MCGVVKPASPENVCPILRELCWLLRFQRSPSIPKVGNLGGLVNWYGTMQVDKMVMMPMCLVSGSHTGRSPGAAGPWRRSSPLPLDTVKVPRYLPVRVGGR